MWTSTNPGVTSLPAASISLAPWPGRSLPIQAILPSRPTAISALYREAPLPSITVPFLMTSLYEDEDDDNDTAAALAADGGATAASEPCGLMWPAMLASRAETGIVL
eukprot:COSAG01_NODE_255_length_20171_cov_8.232164_7_plen_107_part_00